MKKLIFILTLIPILLSCQHDDLVQISGRIENADSIINVWVEDSVYTFSLDENNFFSGSIKMKHNGYATFLHNSLSLYLAPGEDLEIYANAENFSSSLYFRGSLGGINSYLKEQEIATFFDNGDYELEEKAFLDKMRALIDEKTKLLEAKNFDEHFTSLEKQRIQYSIASKVSFYPIYQKQVHLNNHYTPSTNFSKFLSSFSIQNDALFGSRDYRSFLLNYVYLKGGKGNRYSESYSNNIVDYVLEKITNESIKNFLLTEIVFNHIRDNNGLNGADYLLSVFRKECTDQKKIEYIDKLIGLWENIVPGKSAPIFSTIALDGHKVSLNDFKGSYIYIMVWATWCVPCKSELIYLDFLSKKFYDRNIKFLTIAIDDLKNRFQWKDFLRVHPCNAIHTIIEEKSEFTRNYMIISVPRFILINPNGEIVNSNAPRPSGQIATYLQSFAI